MKKKNTYKVLLVALLLIGLSLWGWFYPQREPDVSQVDEPAIMVTEEPTETEIPVIEATEKPMETVAPTQTPTPVEEKEQPKALLCNLSICCDDVLNHLEDLKEEKRNVIPLDGVIFSGLAIEFSDGESVYDILEREMQKKNISLQVVKNPIYKSIYIKGIGGLSEFDCGSSSGWMYRVNGENPTYGCSQYQVKPGDEIVFYYSCSY